MNVGTSEVIYSRFDRKSNRTTEVLMVTTLDGHLYMTTVKDEGSGYILHVETLIANGGYRD